MLGWTSPHRASRPWQQDRTTRFTRIFAGDAQMRVGTPMRVMSRYLYVNLLCYISVTQFRVSISADKKRRTNEEQRKQRNDEHDRDNYRRADGMVYIKGRNGRLTMRLKNPAPRTTVRPQ
ncbi:hypothetical protein SARC_08354 [Sphaeroforma arctica JP610]|uniref:Uncharacterized protein n=1 Tax=Sphaeroforma arctica JP610 TaxID=667725 RepID=A0A0L0FRD0_9EUKA|nr:hypothetical protein SARC_08354 [Sphaeroforma arctica JP610]KNC79244.1 hypothetical protein SARC_08354 [Sphaeroforma arctica JP610]|eukprot:XP_014153146.1 hypothetical protein SARC_08354 [Sphaeroforma arctica JP610]